MDAVFGPLAFRTEIIWKRGCATATTKQGRETLGRIHDILLVFTKTVVVDMQTRNTTRHPRDVLEYLGIL